MTEHRYRPQSLYQAGGSTVANAFHNQAVYCHANDAPITARVVEAVRALLAGETQGRFLARRVCAPRSAPLPDSA